MANGSKLDSFLGVETNNNPNNNLSGSLITGSLKLGANGMPVNAVEANAEMLQVDQVTEETAPPQTPEIRAKSIARCLPQATSVLRLGFETPEGTDPLRPIDPTEKPLEKADLEATPASGQSFEAQSAPASDQIQVVQPVPNVLPTDPGFSLTVPPPMLPLQPGEIGVDIMGNPCDLPGRRVGPETELANGIVAAENGMMPLGLFVRENFNLIVLVLLAILVLRGR